MSGIHLYGDPVLRKKAKPITRITDEECQILSEMAKIMYAAGGIGLAAVQIGIDKQLIVIDVGEGLWKLANPRIIKRQGSSLLEEGCLSFPGVFFPIRRAKKITVSSLNEKGEQLKFEADGLLARTLQHEIEHLKGILIIDHASLKNRWVCRKKIKDLKERSKHAKVSEPERKSRTL
jgi:peptide deformylase